MVICKQVPPELQTPPYVELDDLAGICFIGNRDYEEHTTELFDNVYDIVVTGDYTDTYDYYVFNRMYPSNILDEFLSEVPEGCGSKEARKIYSIIDSGRDYNEMICNILTTLTKEKWETTTIRGCSQGEWQTVFYSTKYWNKESLKTLECEYFNTGTEWEIAYVDDDFSVEEDFDNLIGDCCAYCHSLFTPTIKKEIASYEGISEDEIRLYEFDGWTKKAKYKEL